jgi:ABC-type maltose transport system permease subunit
VTNAEIKAHVAFDTLLVTTVGFACGLAVVVFAAFAFGRLFFRDRFFACVCGSFLFVFFFGGFFGSRRGVLLTLAANTIPTTWAVVILLTGTFGGTARDDRTEKKNTHEHQTEHASKHG